MKTLYLVRHAQSQPSPELSDAQWPLSERGHVQAEQLVAVLTTLGIEEVHTSPYLRCRDTIAPFVTASGVPIRKHHDLRERRVALTIIDNFEEVWTRSWEDFSFALPDCESSDSAQKRVHGAVMDICEGTSASIIAINSHGNALSLLLNHADRRFHLKESKAMRNPDVFRMTFRAGKLAWDSDWKEPRLDEFTSHRIEPLSSR